MRKQNRKRSAQFRRIVFQPETAQGMKQGINQVVAAIRPTLGPVARNVAVSPVLSNKKPELLDKGAVIARRITDLPDRDDDVGAMYIRHMLWRLYEDVGDGTATAAVLFHSIYCNGLKYLASGGNAMRLSHYLHQGLDVILQALDSMTRPVTGEAQLAQLAESICHDPPLAKMLGEVIDVTGEYGQLDVRTGRSREIDREYVEGMYWNRGAVSRQMLSNDERPDYVMMPDAAILLSDLDIDDVQALVTVVAALMKAGIKALLIIGDSFSEDVTNFLTANKKSEGFRAVAVKVPGSTPADKMAALQDIAVLTGSTALHKGAGDKLTMLTPRHLGHARRVWVGRTMFGIISGRRNARTLREHIKALRAQLESAHDPKVRESLQTRLGKLLGGVATLKVGGDSENEIDRRKDVAEATAKVLRRAMRGGVVPGGGVALVDCQQALSRCLENAQDSDERAAYHILLEALEAPLRTLCGNAGYDEATIARAKLAGAGYGVDVHTGDIQPVIERGILDVAPVMKAVVQYAVSSASQALTVDVMIHHKNPPSAASKP